MRLLDRLLGRPAAPVERRMQPRYRMQLDVAVRRGTETFAGRTCDMSLTGMGIVVDAKFEVGDQVELSYSLGDGSPPKLRMVIVRNRGEKRYGVEFVSSE
jgi:hypothetical protein